MANGMKLKCLLQMSTAPIDIAAMRAAARHRNHVITSPMVARKMAAVVAQPSRFMPR